jgi:cell wall-associated NlpC family hydrolase
MKNTLLLLLLCLLYVNFLQAQNKDLEKIRTYYTSKKYYSALKVCDNSLLAVQNKKNPEIYFYKSLCTYKQVNKSSVNYYKTVLSAATIAAKGAVYDKKHKFFTKKNTRFSIFLAVAHKQAEIKYYTNRIKEAKALESIIAKSFKDTSELYHVLFDVVENEKSIPESNQIISLKSNAGKIDSVIHFASTQVGKRYKYGKAGPDVFDCSGFIGYVFKEYGEKLPRDANMIARLGEEIQMEDIEKGDLIFFGNTSTYHVAMYISEKGNKPKIIHCVSRGVCIDDYNPSTHWGKSSVFKIKRVIK